MNCLNFLFCTSLTAFHTHTYLLAFFVCFFVLFYFSYFHARVFGKAFLHEFPISYSHAKWYLLYSLCEKNLYLVTDRY